MTRSDVNNVPFARTDTYKVFFWATRLQHLEQPAKLYIHITEITSDPGLYSS